MLTKSARNFYLKIQPWLLRYECLHFLHTETKLIIYLNEITEHKYTIYNFSVVINNINHYICNLFNVGMTNVYFYNHLDNIDLSWYEDSAITICLQQSYNIDRIFCDQILNLIKFMAVNNRYELWVDFEAWNHPSKSTNNCYGIQYKDVRHLFIASLNPRWYYRLLHYCCLTLSMIDKLTKNSDDIVVNLLSSPIGMLIYSTYSSSIE
jgi:hypothetical protein